MNLAIDIGNSRVKAATFNHGQLIKKFNAKELNPGLLQQWLESSSIEKIIISSVKKENTEDIIGPLQEKYHFLLLDHQTPLPFKNEYKTPDTLGRDRIAGVAGAFSRFKGQNVLVIDAGTCITYDLLLKNTYKGGSISPGIDLRFKALHNFTGQLPLLSGKNINFLTGSDTATSILTGVLNGAGYEADGFIGEYKEKYEDLKIILTGGDASFLQSSMKSEIFAVSELVLEGLNEILEYNT